MISPQPFEIPPLDGPTPLTDELVNKRLGRMVALDPAYKYAQALIEHAKAVERLFWRERKSCQGVTALLAKERGGMASQRAATSTGGKNG